MTTQELRNAVNVLKRADFKEMEEAFVENVKVEKNLNELLQETVLLQSLIGQRYRQIQESFGISSKFYNIEPTPKKPKRENGYLQRITSIMLELGIPASVKGYNYIRSAVLLAIEKPKILEAVTKELYPEVAKKYSTTSCRVERDIRSAIETSWQRGKQETLERIFGYCVSSERGKPTNSEFIALLMDYLLVTEE